MIDGTKQLAGGIEVWAYRRGFLGRERIVRAVVAVFLVAIFAAACIAWTPREASGLVEQAAIAEEIMHLSASASGDEEAQLPQSVILDVPSVDQNPELPTGCESVALTDALLYRGFDLSTTEIADYWLPLSDSDFVNAFLGDPYSLDGNACMAPCIAQTANDYLAAQSSELAASDMTGASLEDLLKMVADGNPVVTWCTIDLTEPTSPYLITWQNGRMYELFENSHCVVVSGFDLASSLVFVSDPLAGDVAYDLATFAYCYYALGSQAVVIS